MTASTGPEPFFYGSAENRLSDKGQVAIPKRFRAVVPPEQLQEGFVVIQGEDECLYMYTHRQFGEIKGRVRALAKEESDPEFFRRFMENAYPVDLDAQGRFVLPGELRRDAGIAGPKVLFIGMDERIEIWSPEKRQASRVVGGEYEKRRKMQAKRIFGF